MFGWLATASPGVALGSPAHYNPHFRYLYRPEAVITFGFNPLHPNACAHLRLHAVECLIVCNAVEVYNYINLSTSEHRSARVYCVK